MPQLTYERDWLSRMSSLGIVGHRALRRPLQWTLHRILERDYTPATSAAERAEVAQGLALAFPALTPAALERLAAEHLKRMYLAGVLWRLMLMSDRAGLEGLSRRYLEVRGGEHLDAAAEDPRPTIFVSAHYGLPVFGALEIARRLHGRKRLNTFFAPPEENLSTVGYPEVFGAVGCDVNCIRVSSRAVASALRALRAGEALTMQPDVYDNATGSAYLLPTFGHLGYVMGGTAFLALKSGARLVPAYCYQRVPGRFTLEVEPALVFAPTGQMEHDLYRLTLVLQRSMEARIQSGPEHWTYWKEMPRRTYRGIRIGEQAGRAEWARALDVIAADAARVVPELAAVLPRIRELTAAGAPATV